MKERNVEIYEFAKTVLQGCKEEMSKTSMLHHKVYFVGLSSPQKLSPPIPINTTSASQKDEVMQLVSIMGKMCFADAIFVCIDTRFKTEKLPLKPVKDGEVSENKTNAEAIVINVSTKNGSYILVQVYSRDENEKFLSWGKLMDSWGDGGEIGGRFVNLL